MEETRRTVDYSIVIPVFCNQETVERLFETLEETVFPQHPDKRHEILFVDDGSTDGSYEKLKAIKRRAPREVKVIKFTRNFGQVAAITAGYQRARGRCVINMAADLQDPPEVILEMLNAFFCESYDVVVGYRRSREDSYSSTMASNLFYGLIRKLSFPHMPKGGFDLALVSDRVKKQILMTPEANPFWQGQILWGG